MITMIIPIHHKTGMNRGISLKNILLVWEEGFSKSNLSIQKE